jgi:hypothetical protein
MIDNSRENQIGGLVGLVGLFQAGAGNCQNNGADTQLLTFPQKEAGKPVRTNQTPTWSCIGDDR